jgi:hypothetical protein
LMGLAIRRMIEPHGRQVRMALIAMVDFLG